MSPCQNSFCRLPLLDGEPKTESRILAVDSEFSGSLENLPQLFQYDEPAASTLLYTAWGLVLRCYTGQDEVIFHARHKTGVNLFQLAFEGDEPLSVYVARAAADNRFPDLKLPQNTPVDDQQRANTLVWIQDGITASSNKEFEAQDTHPKKFDVGIPHPPVAQPILTITTGERDGLGIDQVGCYTFPNHCKYIRRIARLSRELNMDFKESSSYAHRLA